MFTKQIDNIIGTTAAVAGSSGLTVQILMDTFNLVLLVVNLVLALGGIYLLHIRIRVARTEKNYLELEKALLKQRSEKDGDTD